MPIRKKFLLSLVAAIVWAVVITLPFQLEYVEFAGHSPLQFNSVDDAYYLSLALRLGEGVSPEGFYREHAGNLSPVKVLVAESPERVSEYLVGLVGSELKLNSAALGLLLDLISAALSYLAFLYLYRRLGGLELTAHLAVLVSLFFPNLLALATEKVLSHYAIFNLAGSTSAPIAGSYPWLAVFRAVPTQISLPFFALILGSALCLVKSHTLRVSPACAEAESAACASAKFSFLLGLMLGFLIYFYLFAFFSAAFLVFGLELLWVGWCRDSWRAALKGCGAILGGVALATLPAALMIVSHRNSFAHGFPELRQFWFLPVQYLVWSAVLLWGALSPRFGERSRIIMLLMLLCLLAELGFAALQSLSGIWLEPFHVGWLYTGPLFSGLLVCLLGNWLWRYRVGRFAAMTALVTCVALVGVSVKALNDYLETPIAIRTEVIEFTNFLEHSRFKNEIVAFWPWRAAGSVDALESVSSTANIIHAITDQQIFYQVSNRLSFASEQELLQRYLQNRAIFVGPEANDEHCQISAPKLPGDIFSYTGVGRHLLMRAQCERYLQSNAPELALAKPTLALCEAETGGPCYACRDPQREVWRSSNGMWRACAL